MKDALTTFYDGSREDEEGVGGEGVGCRKRGMDALQEWMGIPCMDRHAMQEWIDGWTWMNAWLAG